eukprot:11271630-Heterocapsa_arctica.AAC.1
MVDNMKWGAARPQDRRRADPPVSADHCVGPRRVHGGPALAGWPPEESAARTRCSASTYGKDIRSKYVQLRPGEREHDQAEQHLRVDLYYNYLKFHIKVSDNNRLKQ